MVKVRSQSSNDAVIRLPPPVERTACTAWTSASPPPKVMIRVGVSARGFDQPVAVRAVVGNDRDAFGFESLENFGLGVGDRLF